MLLSVFVKLRNPRNNHIIGLSSTGCEDDFLRLGTYDGSNFGSGVFACFLRVEAVGVRSGMWVAKLVSHVGHHGVQDTGIHWGGSLVIEVERKRLMRQLHICLRSLDVDCK